MCVHSDIAIDIETDYLPLAFQAAANAIAICQA